jgi:hypothetical protein
MFRTDLLSFIRILETVHIVVYLCWLSAILIAVNTVSRLLMMESKSVRNMYRCISKQSWEIVHFIVFYYRNISRCMFLRMSNSSYILFITNLVRTLYTIRSKSSVLPKCSKMSVETYKICDTCRVSTLFHEWRLFYIRRVTSRLYCPAHFPFVICKTSLLVDFSKTKWPSVIPSIFVIKETFITADE